MAEGTGSEGTNVLGVIARRLLVSVPLVFVVTAATFVLVAIAPGNVAYTILGANATRAQFLQLDKALGLNEPLPERYWHWLTAAIHGDLGRSLVSGLSVSSTLNQRLGVTLSLVIGSTLVALLLGLLLGIAAALRHGLLARFLDGLSLIGLGVPNFFLALLLIAWFAVSLRVFPVSGYVTISASPFQWLRSLALPVITLAMPSVAVVAKQTRDAMLGVLERPFMRTLRAAGVSRSSLILKHALRNAAIPVATVVGIVFVGALSGTVIAESIFALPGLGGVAVQATTGHDIPLIQGVTLYFTILVVIVNLIVDLAYAALNPRVRVS